jgi:23S rRNA pseudouridine1911/1915/1917 synthase
LSSRWSWVVESNKAGTRADKAITEALESGQGEWEGNSTACSRSRLQKLMEEGLVSADGVQIRSNLPLESGMEIEIDFPEAKPILASAEEIPFEILYDDESLLVVNKPPNLTVHPSVTQTEGTLVNALLHRLKKGDLTGLSGIGGVLRPGIVHRIDKNTSGALVISKTDEAHHKLTEIFSKHEIERKYWALCYGTPSQVEGTIRSTLGRNPNDRKKMAMDVPNGRIAITHFKLVEKYGAGLKASSPAFASWLEVTLETGRTHQIRVHLTSIGNSVLGDPVYGEPSERQSKWVGLPGPVQAAVKALPGQALHARVLGFNHPITGKALRFEAEPPEGFSRLLHSLKQAL